MEAWQALIDAKKWGLIRSIGVCNFLPEHIERLEKETGVMPSINQIELHPFFNQEEQRKYHEENNITTQSWSPFTRGLKDLQIETHPNRSPNSIKVYFTSYFTLALSTWSDCHS